MFNPLLAGIKTLPAMTQTSSVIQGLGLKNRIVMILKTSLLLCIKVSVKGNAGSVANMAEMTYRKKKT